MATAGLHIDALSYYVYDINRDRIVIASNERVQLPLASLTKLATAIVALETFEPDHLLTVSATALGTEGDSGLVLGEVWTLDSLLKFMLIASSNDAATVLGEELESKTNCVMCLNKLIDQLGLSESFFLNYTGLDESLSLAGGYGSARDVAKLTTRLWSLSKQTLDVTTRQELKIESETAIHKVVNTNRDVLAMLGILASKTGTTDLAGANLVVIIDAGIDRPVILVLLGATKEKRAKEMQKLISWTLANIDRDEK